MPTNKRKREDLRSLLMQLVKQNCHLTVLTCKIIAHVSLSYFPINMSF